MGLMDKAKEAALQAKASAEKMAHQGQAKVAEMQQHRTEGEMYRTLGEAYYQEQRRGGDHQAVANALDALDQHFATAGPGGTAGPGTTGAAGGSQPGTPAGGEAVPPSDSYKVDDV